MGLIYIKYVNQMRITKFMKEMSMFSSFYDRNRNIYSGRGTNFLTSVERECIGERIKRKML